jgi:hypothetical protein
LCIALLFEGTWFFTEDPNDPRILGICRYTNAPGPLHGDEPDGSELLAANASSCTIDIIDLTTGKDLKSIVPTPGNQPGTLYPNGLVATANGTALVSLVNPSLLDEGELVEVNLSTGITTIVQANTVAETLLTASADGTTVYMDQSARGGSSGGLP